MNLLKSFSVYTFSNFFNKGLALLLTAIISFYITEEDSGILALLNTYVLLVSVFLGLGAKGALAVKYFQVEKSQFTAYFTALQAGPFFVFLLFLLLFLGFSNTIASFIELPQPWIFYILVVAASQNINDIMTTMYRVENRAKNFAFFNIGWGILNFGLSLLLIFQPGLGNWQGRALGILGSGIVFSIISITAFFKSGWITTRIEQAFVKDGLLFGLPLIPHFIGAFAIEYSDAIFLQKMMGKAELGLYSYGYRFGMLIQILVTSFSLGFGPFLFSSLKNLNEELKLKIVRIAYLFMAGLFIAVLFLGWMSPYLFKWVLDEKFFPGSRYVFWVALAYFFFGAYSLFANYIHYSGKTYIFSWLAILNVALNAVLNYFLILEYGTIGAAYATLISYVVVFLITAAIANRLYPMPWFDLRVFKRAKQK